MSQVIFTENNAAGLIARLFLGAALLPHGLQKTLGWFGGKGFFASLDGLEAMGIPPVLGFLVIATESVGAVALIFGVFGRFMAAFAAIVLIGAVVLKHAAFGFFMNWTGMQEGEGWEYHLLAVGLALVVMVMGSGSVSFDRWLTRRYWA